MRIIKKIKEKRIPHFLKNFLLFLIIIFLLDYSIGSLLRYFYFKQSSGLLYRTTYAMDSTRAEVVIFGSSTANHHYYPKLFEDRLQMSAYNAGRDGNGIFYHTSILKCILKRYSPKIAILDLSTEEFNKDQESYDRISSLLPYYDSHPEIHSIIQLKSPYEKYKLLSKIYPFNSLIFTIAIGNTNYNKNRETTNDENGYLPIKRIWNRPIATYSFPKMELDTNKINSYRIFIRDCINSNVRLYIIISPRFVKYLGRSSSIATASQIANEFKIPFYNFSNCADFINHQEFFANVLHL
ncbi:MAG: hypothetical protein ABI172_10885, partial [Ginsengibacter sp.]